ncbi:MAG: immune inhibitor A [Bacteroidales bacterium]|nr:immune inhibitor A [Candidatus Latescibacterota bacterium]
MNIFVSLLALLLILSGSEVHAGRVPSPSGTAISFPGTESRLYQERALASLVAGVPAIVDTLKVLFIRVSFPDLQFSPFHDDSYFDNELRHLVEYYDGASLGNFTLICDLASETIVLPFESAYYGDNEAWDALIPEMMISIVDSLDYAYDFTGWDSYAVIHAGAGRETDFLGDSGSQLWSGFIDPGDMAELLADTLGTPGIPTDDGTPTDTFYIDNIMVLPEEASQDGYIFGAIGIYAYQIGKRLGMVRLFDPSPSGGPDSQGIGSFGLMGYGLYNALGFVPSFPCAFQRYLMGWVEPVRIPESKTVNLKNINGAAQGDTVLLRIDAGPSEYFLIANRLHDHDLDGRFDFIDINMNGIPENEDTLAGAEFDFYVTGTTDPNEMIDEVKYTDTGSGIKIWHIDEKIIADRLAVGEGINSRALQKGVDLEEADGVQDMDRRGGSYAFGSYLDSYRAGVNDRFGENTLPSSDLNSGIPSGIDIFNISETGPVMRLSISVDDVEERVTAVIPGDMNGMAPVAVYPGGDSEPRLLIATNESDTGRIHIITDPTSLDWELSVEQIVEIEGVRWTTVPVSTDVDGDLGTGDLSQEILITSEGCIHVFRGDGAPYPIDTDSTPGALEVMGNIVTAGASVEIDGTPGSEVAFLVSDGDSIYLYIVGLEVDQGDPRYAGPGVYFRCIVEGRPVSHPAVGVMKPDAPGLFFAAAVDGFVRLVFVDISGSEAILLSEEAGRVESLLYDDDLSGGVMADSIMMLVPASGDIDGDDNDEMVIGIPGTGLIYFDPVDEQPFAAPVITGRGIIHAAQIGIRPSPPALSDLDDDGILDTIVRDRERLWMLKGFGVTAVSWPQTIDPALSGLEEGGPLPQPLAADIDGDGLPEAVFGIAGDIHIVSSNGQVSGDSPVRGERGDGQAHAMVRDGQGSLYLFSNGSSYEIIGTLQTGLVIERPSSRISRTELGESGVDAGEWLDFRNGGSGRQSTPEVSVSSPGRVDSESLYCYPNPAVRSGFTLRLNISGVAEVKARLLGLEGEEVAVMTGVHPWGAEMMPFEMKFSGMDLASGIYIIQVFVTGEGWDWRGAMKVGIVR